MKHKNCPNCGSDFDGGSILDTFISQRNDGVKCWQGKSDSDIELLVKKYYSPPYRWERIIGVELPHDHPDYYDGISFYKCPDCDFVIEK